MPIGRTRVSVVSLILVLATLWLVLGCAKTRPREVEGLEAAWSRARSYFQRERYLKAQTVLKDILLNYPGSAIIDSVQYYYALTFFELGEYITAADEFHRLLERFPFSRLGGEAAYFEARSYYEQSPHYALDQEYTHKALQGFQRFLEDWPRHALTDSGYRYLALCREKLAHKEYAAAVLYYDMREYASAVFYADVVLDDYYDTSFAAPAQFLKARSFFALKDWARAARELQTYLAKFPNGRHRARAERMLEQALRRNGGPPPQSARMP